MSDVDTGPRPKRARRATRPLTTDDAIELAMEAEAAGHPASGPAADLIRTQARLVGWQIASERANFSLKVLTAVVGIVVAVIVATMLISAANYRGLTIQPFSVPPELEARGLDGSAVAARLLDKLSALQNGTISLRAPNSYANSWGDTVEVEIPQTGVSAGELWRFLRSWLGEEVKITGELVRQTDGRLQITARAGGDAPPPVLGDEAELEALLDQVAEAIFQETQPYRYAVYLTRTGRMTDAIAAFENLAATGDETDRKWALAGLSLQLQRIGDFDGAIARAEEALEIDPDFGLARANLAGVLGTVGRIEESYQHELRTAQALRNDADLNPEISAGFILEMEATVLDVEHDHQGAAALLQRAAEFDSRSQWGAGLQVALQHAYLHDVARGRRALGRAPTTEDSEALLSRDSYEAVGCLILEDWPCFTRLMDAVLAPAPAPDRPEAASRQIWLISNAPFIALGRAHSGDLAGAQSLIAETPTDTYLAAEMRGRIFALSGDAEAAERWFARAVALAPSLADGRLAWGRARLARGDHAGAIEQFELAADRAPRWADPLKFWGDALAAQGEHRGAIRRYGQAMERAPRWGALHLALGRSLAASGRTDEARERWRAAAGMDLNPADRAEVRQRLAG